MISMYSSEDMWTGRQDNLDTWEHWYSKTGMHGKSRTGGQVNRKTVGLKLMGTCGIHGISKTGGQEDLNKWQHGNSKTGIHGNM